MKVAVILASLFQKENIERIKEQYKKMGYLVYYPMEQPDKTLLEIYVDYLHRISRADEVVAITKEDGSFGESVTYEIAFAKYLKKPLTIIDLGIKS